MIDLWLSIPSANSNDKNNAPLGRCCSVPRISVFIIQPATCCETDTLRGSDATQLPK